ncbi:AEC family transporter [Aquirhabdus sp.]|uniref:AEC family transporter n=1 Tax=Aquirhabdus sp. TaxID=2824160 RepID=UPI00396C8594
MYSDFSTIILPIFVCSGLGLLWVKLKLPMHTATLSSLVSNLGIPCLLLSSLNRPGLTLSVLGHTFLAGALALFGFALVSMLALRLMRLPIHKYLPSLMLPNTANLGIPVALFALGQEGLLYAVAFSALVQIGHYTLGVWLLSGHGSLRNILTSPTIWAILVALGMLATHTALPDSLQTVTHQLGAMAPPLMLLMLGASLAEIRLEGLGRVLILSLVRVCGGLGIGLLIAHGLGLPPLAASALIIQSAMPVAVLSHLIAQQYQGPSRDIAGMILISTLLVFIGLPLLLSLI